MKNNVQELGSLGKQNTGGSDLYFLGKSYKKPDTGLSVGDTYQSFLINGKQSGSTTNAERINIERLLNPRNR